MLLVKPTANYIFLFLVFLFSYFVSSAQENSPYSRYGLGDLYPQQHIASRGMGGLTAAFVNPQAINTVNPASYGSLSLVTYDIGLSIDARTLLSANPVSKYSSTNFLPSYLQLGIPLNKRGAGLVFGIRPVTRINYNVEESKLVHYDSLGITDSIHTVYEGDGGLNQVFFGLGKRWKNFSAGFNAGYEWGSKNISTKVNFPADSLHFYPSNSSDTTHFWGLFLNPGFMGNFKLKQRMNPVAKTRETYYLNIGASGTVEQKLKASKTITRQTFSYTDAGVIVPIDSISKVSGIEGVINIPLTYTAGFMFTKTIASVAEVNKWGIGADYTSTKWTKYRYYGLPDQLNDSWYIHVGAEFSPDPLSNKSLFSRGMYRAGFYTGKDYINADGNGYKVRALTLGYSFNLRRFRSYDKQFTMINTAIEFGKRGTSINNVTENFFKFSLGLSLSDVWFIKRKYD
ncbi:MAG: hypothetical protein ABJA71_15830 [Ginsengibacter sp.]